MAEIAFTIVGKLVEYLVEPIERQFGYMCCYNSNVENLTSQVEKLEHMRVGVEMRVDAGKRNSEIVGPDVEAWRGLADKSERDERRGRAAEIGSLSSGGFKGLESRILIMKEVMEALTDDEISMIGIRGMGGVGKTTMAKEVAKKAKAENLFDEIVMAVVSQNPDLMKIQCELGDMLGLKFEKKTILARAGRLYARLTNGNRILVIWMMFGKDLIWEKLKFLWEMIAIGAKLYWHHDSKACVVIWEHKKISQFKSCLNKKHGIFSRRWQEIQLTLLIYIP
ncbi:hypothetical protein F0562_017583 [Nyssa sinensis]|uniref:NB-ARC domain-containing protein n=1 Tax=Nyssa sinensis TaxID=561372 RepID=A0A5J4ZFJ4_9ASTE|nr:hypothetical protein F0562_017583 [Nyssa sinensis]